MGYSVRDGMALPAPVWRVELADGGGECGTGTGEVGY